jgi:predicted nucleotidyltransferase
MNINGILERFAQQELVLGRKASERERIKNSLSHLKRVLSNQFDIDEFITFGSYTRNTILPRDYDSSSDIDLMVVFKVFNNIHTPETYRTNLKKVISHAYPNSLSKKDFPAVKLVLNHIKFDIVPAYMQSNLWNGDNYMIPDRNGRWQSTNPNDINDSLASYNNSYGNNTIRHVIRLCKHWNANSGRPYESYLMEKEILRYRFLFTENTYERFIKTIERLGYRNAGVIQAVSYIKQYQGDFWNEANPEKQLQWLQKLLPGLRY